MSAPELALADLADGVLLLSALALLVWPRLAVARPVLLVVVALVGLGGAATGPGLWPRVAALAVAALSAALVEALFRTGTPEAADPDRPASAWPRWTDRPSTGEPGLDPSLASTLRAAGFLVLLLLCVGAVQGIRADGLHPRGVLAIGLTVLLAGAAIAAQASRPGLVQMAGAALALAALGWVSLRLGLRPEGEWPLCALAGLPAGLLLACVLAMCALSAVLRDWLRDGVHPSVPPQGPPR